MMGQLPPQQNELFYDFCLEKHIPEDHLLRQIDQFLDFEPLREHLQPFYSHTGRPSIDPELMIRMLLVGYSYGIRSERRLCEEVKFNLAYRWFCKLGLDDKVPDHSSFSKNRRGRFQESNLLRLMFDNIVKACHEEGLIKGEGFATDASYVQADASWENIVSSNADFLESHGDGPAVEEYLAALDNNPELTPEQKRISLTDPLARWMTGRNRGPARFYYCTNYLMDTAHNVIVDVKATPSNRILEVESTKKMIEHVEKTIKVKPKRLLADTAYGAGPMLEWLVKDKNIEPHIPVWDKTNQKPETFNVKEFIWDEESKTYTCPAGKKLVHGRRKLKKPRPVTTKSDTLRYRAAKKDCDKCKYIMQCSPSGNPRKIDRSIYEESREVARKITESEVYLQTFKERRKVEVLFGHLKQILNLRRLRLRGLKGANDEFILAAAVQNLKKLAQLKFKPPDHRKRVPVI